MLDKIKEALELKHSFRHIVKNFTDQENFPGFHFRIPNDPQLGFDKPRKERVMVATAREMEVADVPLQKRGYCAHLYIHLKSCHTSHPYFDRQEACKSAAEEYHHCVDEDTIIRMKEHERQYRLNKRQTRMEARRKEAEMSA